MAFVNPLNVDVQTWWSKNRVVVSGLVVAIFTAISPLFIGKSHDWDVRAIIVAACMAISSYLAKDLRGKTWTMAGQIFGGLAVYASLYTGDFDAFRFLVSIILPVLGIPIPPVKLSTYEHAPTIVSAKKEAEQIKEIRNDKNEAAKTSKG